jgi:hypothetical protein
VAFLCEEEAKKAKLPKRIQTQVGTFRSGLREEVVTIAKRMETNRLCKIKQRLAKHKLPPLQASQAQDIQSALCDILVSYHSITQGLDVLRHFNEKILNKIERAKGSKKAELMLFNAVITYEVTDLVISFLRNFELKGREQLETICEAVEQELNKQQQEDNRIYTEAKNGQSDAHVRVAKNVEDRRKIREMVEKKWNEIWARVDGLEQNVLEAKGGIDELELVRDNARGQIDLLQVMGVTHLVQSNIESLDRLGSVNNIQLAPLTADDVLSMIGQPS